MPDLKSVNEDFSEESASLLIGTTRSPSRADPIWIKHYISSLFLPSHCGEAVESQHVTGNLKTISCSPQLRAVPQGATLKEHI